MLIVELEARIDPLVNERAIQLAGRIRAAALDGVRDVVATYRSVGVFFDPLHTRYEDLLARLEHEADREDAKPPAARPPLRVPVCYGGELGPDLGGVASHARLPADEVIAIHASRTYRVFMLGFLPGFAYMGLVDERLEVARHSTPRVRVSEGSVGLAGRQTGIYPVATPGGWQILGRTPVRPFDISRPSPFLFSAGDSVQFVPVNREEYDRLVRLPSP
jgi:KipI family sensor histidine kinase inhibitor